MSQLRRGQTVRHLDSGIVGHVVELFRARINPAEPQQRDYATVRWSGGGIVTDEPAYALAPHPVEAPDRKAA